MKEKKSPSTLQLKKSVKKIATIKKMSFAAANDTLIPHYSKFIDFYSFDLKTLTSKEPSLTSPFSLLFDS